MKAKNQKLLELAELSITAELLKEKSKSYAESIYITENGAVRAEADLEIGIELPITDEKGKALYGKKEYLLEDLEWKLGDLEAIESFTKIFEEPIN